MDPLQTLLRPAMTVVNRNIHETSSARELCAELAGSIIAVRVKDSALASYFVVHDDCVDISNSSENEPHAIISGSLISLSRMLIRSDTSMLRDGSIELTGDAEIAQRFQTLLSLARPDLEEEASNVIGDVAAHRLGNLFRGLGRWGRATRSTMGANVREYLQEESRETPSRFEAEEFAADVSTLRDDVERAEARLRRLRDND